MVVSLSAGAHVRNSYGGTIMSQAYTFHVSMLVPFWKSVWSNLVHNQFRVAYDQCFMTSIRQIIVFCSFWLSFVELLLVIEDCLCLGGWSEGVCIPLVVHFMFLRRPSVVFLRRPSVVFLCSGLALAGQRGHILGLCLAASMGLFGETSPALNDPCKNRVHVVSLCCLRFVDTRVGNDV